MDNLTKKQRRKNMQNIRSKGTLPERSVMRELRRMNIYFAKYVGSITGKPDIVFRKKKVAVFIDSDFWHGHPQRGVMPKSNLEYWQKKIRRNKRRDAVVTQELRGKGWTVLRIWEHNLKRHYKRSINKILKTVEKG